MSTEKESFIEDIIKELESENVAVFAGAGLSIPAGYVGWSQLLEPIAKDLKLDIKKEKDLVSLAQYHLNEYKSRAKLNKKLIEEFFQELNLTDNHRILARLPISTYWTTNYDKLIERSLYEVDKKVDVKYTLDHLSRTIPKRNAIVFKMHGDIEHPNNVILTKDDYESYHIKMDQYLSTLKGDLLTKTFIFIGFSFTDPNLDYILSRVRNSGVSQREHYCFLRKINEDDYAKNDEGKADYDYENRKQELFISDLKRFSIRTILVDKYNEITDILAEVERRYKRKNIFISGAAYEYEPWGRIKSEEFVHDLSKKFIENDYRIVSGFGLGIGSAVISGALKAIYLNSSKHSKDELILRPFPQNIEGREFWTQNRKDMISYAGIAIFLFGNKLEGKETIFSNGMREEFEIAKANNLLLVPIGATGYISEELWNELKEEYDQDSYYLNLNNKDLEPNELIDSILEFLEKNK